MPREYFHAYHSYLKSLDPLNDAERGRLFTACLEYSMTGAEPELRGNERFVFPMIRSQIDRDVEKYRAKCDTQSRNASMRWHATACDGMPTDAKHAKEKGKEKEKEKENTGDICAEPETVSTPPVITLTLNDGSEYPVLEEQADELQSLYPAVDVMQELREMRAWCTSHPKKRKTKRGINAFITSWLSKEQDRGGAARNKQDKRGRGQELLDMIGRGEFGD